MNTDRQALENTRRMAHDAMERASNTVNSLRTGVHDAASRSAHAMSERAAAAQRYMGEYAHLSKSYVTEHPLKSALIAAAVGAAVAGLVLALRHRRDQDRYF